jgi:hypothetical protein
MKILPCLIVHRWSPSIDGIISKTIEVFDASYEGGVEQSIPTKEMTYLQIIAEGEGTGGNIAVPIGTFFEFGIEGFGCAEDLP